MSQTVVLRKVGGSVMIAVPPALLAMTDLSAGKQVELSVEDGRIIVEPRRRPHYTLAELLARCDPAAPRDERDDDWLRSPRAGRELL